MKKHLLAAAFVAGLVAGPSYSPAFATPVTADGAQSLRTVFEAYLGKGQPGQPPVRVTPAGDSYTISLDLRALASPLAAAGVTVTVAPYEMKVKPMSDGLWQVSGGNFPPVHIAIKDQTITLVMEGMSFEGLFDPKIKSFVFNETRLQALRMAAQAPGFQQSRLDGPTNVQFTAAASGPGAVSVNVTQTVENIRQVYTFSKKGQTSDPTSVSVLIGPMNVAATIDSLRLESLLDLWAFFVANHSKPAIQANFETLRGKLKAAMPLFNALSQTGTVKDITVTTPFGPAKLGTFGGTLEMNGLRPDGRVRTQISFDGLSLPPAVANGMLPPWSKGLLPTAATFDLTVTQYNLAVAANMILDNLRPDMPKSESDALGRRAAMAIAPGGRVKIAIGNSRIRSDMLDVEFSGDIDVNIPVPKARIVARAKGFDETIRALQPFVEKDKKLQQAMLGMIAAKGFGKALPDGRLEWVVEVDPAGTASVNGFKVPLPGGRKR